MNSDIWTTLAAPLTKDEVSWRIDGKTTEKNGSFSARVVAYADVPVVVRRLDSVVPGEWQFKASDPVGSADGDGVAQKAIRGSLTIRGVTREDYGQGPDEKQALTDAIKRTARLFGIALELWDMGPVWVAVSDGGKYPKITGDPWAEYQRKQRSGTSSGPASAGTAGVRRNASPPHGEGSAPVTTPVSDATDFIMPIGKQRGRKIGLIASDDLRNAVEWCHSHQLTRKHADLLSAIARVLLSREQRESAA